MLLMGCLQMKMYQRCPKKVVYHNFNEWIRQMNPNTFGQEKLKLYMKGSLVLLSQLLCLYEISCVSGENPDLNIWG